MVLIILCKDLWLFLQACPLTRLGDEDGSNLAEAPNMEKKALRRLESTGKGCNSLTECGGVEDRFEKPRIKNVNFQKRRQTRPTRSIQSE